MFASPFYTLIRLPLITFIASPINPTMVNSVFHGLVPLPLQVPTCPSTHSLIVHSLHVKICMCIRFICVWDSCTRVILTPTLTPTPLSICDLPLTWMPTPITESTFCRQNADAVSCSHSVVNYTSLLYILASNLSCSSSPAIRLFNILSSYACCNCKYSFASGVVIWVSSMVISSSIY